jgi:alpha-glucuronidase
VEGVRAAEAMQKTWSSLAGRVDPRRHEEVADRLAIQAADAAKWRDHILQYFQSINKLPISGE